MGVLGCPNLPTSQLRDEDGTGNSAGKAGTDGVGVIFSAQKGVGAFAGPLAGRQAKLFCNFTTGYICACVLIDICSLALPPSRPLLRGCLTTCSRISSCRRERAT